jgi:hypothetical protein
MQFSQPTRRVAGGLPAGHATMDGYDRPTFDRAPSPTSTGLSTTERSTGGVSDSAYGPGHFGGCGADRIACA